MAPSSEKLSIPIQPTERKYLASPPCPQLVPSLYYVNAMEVSSDIFFNHHAGSGRLSWWLNSDTVLSDVARSAPQGDYYHTTDILLASLTGNIEGREASNQLGS